MQFVMDYVQKGNRLKHFERGKAGGWLARVFDALFCGALRVLVREAGGKIVGHGYSHFGFSHNNRINQLIGRIKLYPCS